MTLHEFLTQFKEETIIGSYLLVAVLLELAFKQLKSYLKNRVYAKHIDEINTQNGEFFTEYYRKSQIIDVIRVVLFIGVILLIILYKSPSAFNLAIVATWAMIITFKDLIQSFVGFFFIISQFRVGDTVVVGWIQGEIIYIRPFYVGIIGKDEDGEHTGQLYFVPGNRFLMEPVRREELKTTGYRRESVEITYRRRDFTVDFPSFVERLTGYLDGHLPLRTLGNVGNFRTYIGYRYKLDFDGHKDGVLVRVSFVGKPIKNTPAKHGIFAFVEWLRAERKDEEGRGGGEKDE